MSPIYPRRTGLSGGCEECRSGRMGEGEKEATWELVRLPRLDPDEIVWQAEQIVTPYDSVYCARS
jgi:hypothetical protein